MFDAQQFQAIASHFEHVTFNPSVYAKDFVDHLNRLEREGKGDEVTDINTPAHEVLLHHFEDEPSVVALGSRSRPR